jgi:hypothetical protein
LRGGETLCNKGSGGVGWEGDSPVLVGLCCEFCLNLISMRASVSSFSLESLLIALGYWRGYSS